MWPFSIWVLISNFVNNMWLHVCDIPTRSSASKNVSKSKTNLRLYDLGKAISWGNAE